MPGLFIGWHTLNYLRYADETVLIAVNDRNTQDRLGYVVMEIDEKRLTNEKTESDAREKPKYRLDESKSNKYRI